MRWLLAFAVFAAALVLVAVSPQQAAAAACTPGTDGVPAINMSKDVPSEVLFGNDLRITLNASEPSGELYSGYNLSFRDVIPPGTVYKPGSASVAPTIINNQPALGYTTLIFSNVSDLAPGSDFSLSYEITQVTSGPTALEVGDVIRTGDQPPFTVTGAGAAFVNCNPREVPRFTAAGMPIPGAVDSYSSSVQGIVSDTLVTALEITKSEPSPEHELLRGVHDQQTVYTLKVRNNSVNPTNSVLVDDYLPAGLEFLSCATADNTIDAPTNPGSQFEYPGSGLINDPGNAPTFTEPCLVPTLVETITVDPDGGGPLPIGVYTHVQFDLGAAENFSPAGEFAFQYAAAIPICPNSLDWNGAAPTNGIAPPTTGQQGSNLDNNSCGFGGETVDETALTNYALATGDYQSAGGPITETDSDQLTVTAEDLAVRKQVSDPALEVGAITSWTLNVRTSEYRTFTNTTINDTLPDGYCPIDSTVNHESPPTAECGPTGIPADDPTVDGVPTPYSSATENVNGTWAVIFNLGDVARNAEFAVVFKSRTRHDYQENFLPDGPILSGDSSSNLVDLAGDNQPICSDAGGVVPCPGGSQIFHTETPGLINIDDSTAGQTAGFPTLEKQVRLPGGGVPVDCSTGASTYVPGTASTYRPGDVVCWKLRVDFPSLSSTAGITLTDFLPVGTSYAGPQPTGAGATANNDFPGTTVTDNNTFLEFFLGDPVVDEGGLTFEWIIGTVVDNDASPPLTTPPTLRGNLLKLSTTDTLGQVTTERDSADFTYSAPSVTMTKGVRDINNLPAGGNGPNVDGGTVVGTDVVTYRIDLSNSGLIDAVNTVVHERVIGPYDCTMISAISDGGSCVTTGAGVTAVTTITWDAADNVTVTPGSNTKTLTWDFTAPGTIAPFAQINDNACVDAYQNDTNLGGQFAHYPLNPVPSCGTPPGTTNAVAANDTSFVVGAGTFVKTRSTSLTETNNSGATQATIGEEILYTVSYTVPAHTTVYNAVITDPITAPTRQAFVAGSLNCSLTGSPDACGSGALTGFSTAFASNTVTWTFPSTYANTTGTPQVFNLTFRTQVVDIGTNIAGGTLTNRGTLNQSTQYGVAAAARNTTTVSTTIVEPNPQIVKSDDEADNIVSPNQEVQYNLTVTNPSLGGAIPPATPAHNSVVVDHVPVGLTPSNGSGGAIPNGGTAFLCNGTATALGIWDSTLRTITWTPSDIAPGSSTVYSYCVTVDNNPAGQQILTNNVDLTGTSMPGVVVGERSYTDSASDTVTVEGATVAKTVAPTSATIGDDLGYTVTVTVPANVIFYDFVVTDVLPDGVDFASFDSVTCTSGCLVAFPPATTNQTGQTLTWSFGDVPASTQARTVVIEYTAHVADLYSDSSPVQSGDILTNTADAGWREAPAGPIVTSPDATASVTVIEPVLAIDKDVSGQTGDTDVRNTQPGDGYTYTIVVSNTGNSTAHNVVVQDQPPAGIENVVPVSGAGFVQPPGWVNPGDTITWNIASIPAGGSETLTYTADLAPSAQLTNGQLLANTAHVPEYWGVPLAERSANPTVDYREYNADPSDTVTMTLRLPQLSIAKTTGAGAESGNAELDQPFAWRVTLSNTSTYATAYDVDFADVLPAGWTYDSGSATFTPGGAIEPGISGQTLTWPDVGDIAPGGNIVLNFTATPTAAALVSGNPVNPYTNNASATGDDASGASGSFTGPYASGPDGAQANILMPTLGIVKTPDSGAATAGTASSFTIAVTNSGAGTARGVVVTDLLPSGLTYTPGSATAAGGVNFSEASVTANTPTAATTQIIWNFDSIAPGATATITLPVFVPADTVLNTTFTNTSSAHSNERPTDVTDSGSLIVGTAADVGIVKTDGGATGTAGENVTYTLTTTNYGPSIANNAVVTDNIDLAQFSFVSITPAAGNAGDSCGFVSPTVTCTASGPMTILAPTRSYTLVLQIRPDVTTTVSNTATVAADEDPGSPNNTSTDTTPVVTSADLVVTKNVSSGSSSTILNHDETEFTMTVENNGPSDALNVALTDDLPAGLSCVSTTPSGPSVTGCAGAPGEVVIYALGTIPAGTTVTVTMTVRGEVVGTQINPAAATSTTPLINPGDDSDSANVVVDPMADVAVTKTAPPTIESGEDLTYTMVVTNNGPDPAANVTLSDQLPAGVSYQSHTTTAGSCNEAALLFSCSFGTLNSGDSITITVLINVGFNYPIATLSNTVTVASTTGDLIPANNADTAVTLVGPNADVSIIKTGPAYGAAQHALTYTLAVQNAGPTTAQDVTVSDPLPAGTSFVSATPSVGTCAAAAGVVTCDLGDMAIGDSVLIQLVVMPSDALANTTITNTATVSSITPDPVPSNNTDSAQTPIENSAFPTSSDLSLTKTSSSANPAVGDKVTFTMTATNAGPSTATNAVVVDALPAGLFYDSSSGATCTAAGQIVTCPLGDIAPGASVSFQLVAVVMQTGAIVNSATVTANNDREPGNNAATAPINSRASTAKLSLTKVASKRTVQVGRTVSFKIVVKNISKVNAVNVKTCDIVPSRLSVVRKGGGTLSKGNLCWTVPFLEPGKSKTYRVTMRVSNGKKPSITNPARATSGNAGAQRARAKIFVPQVSPRGGGTTG